MTRLNEKPRYVFIFSFITALHALLFFHTLTTSKSEKGSSSKRPVVIKVFKEPSQSKQIVQSVDTKDQLKKEKAFLSDKTRSFERQTKAKRVGAFSSGGGDSVELSQLGHDSNPFHEAATAYAKKKQRSKKNSQSGISSTNDHLPDIPAGDLTQLNTVEYKYYGFYHRIRQKLEQFWGRSIHEKARELASAGRQIATSDEFLTALRITLDPMGRVIEIELIGASGVKELDEAAIESFNQAGPFPNPPKDLIVNGKVTLEWGFVVSS